jgi:hypothetical protein
LLINFSTVTFEKDKLALRIEQLNHQLGRNASLDELIKPYAAKSFWFMCIYCAFAALVLTFNAFKWWNFQLAEGVLQTLVGSTAVSVIGLVGMVLTGVFIGARGK